MKRSEAWWKAIQEAEELTLKEMGLTEFPPEMQLPIPEERPVSGGVLISEAARRVGISPQAIRRQIAEKKLRAEKRHNQWYVDEQSLAAMERHYREELDQDLQEAIRYAVNREWEESHPDVDRSWDYDPFERGAPSR